MGIAVEVFNKQKRNPPPWMEIVTSTCRRAIEESTRPPKSRSFIYNLAFTCSHPSLLLHRLVMPPNKRTAPVSNPEPSPDPLQMTPGAQTEELPLASARKSTRSRKASDVERTPVAPSSDNKAVTSARKRAQPDTQGESSDERERASKRSKMAEVEKIIALARERAMSSARNDKTSVANDTDSPKPQEVTPSTTKKRGRPPKTAVAESPRVVTTYSKRTPSTKKQAAEPAAERNPDASPTKPTRSKRTRSTAPVRHSSNPLDDELRDPSPDTEADVSLGLAELVEPSSHAVGTAFDLSSGQSREAFLRNERWQRDKEARNFNFEGDVHEGRRLRSGKAVVVVETEESEEEAGETEGDAGDESLDEDERRNREAAGEKEKEAAIFEADNDYLSQLTYDTTMPVETQKSTLQESIPAIATATGTSDQSSSSSMTPLTRKVLRAVISNLAGCESYTPATAIQPEEEKNEALVQLVNLLKGTVERGEGNSCLILGAKGSGKTRVWKAVN